MSAVRRHLSWIAPGAALAALAAAGCGAKTVDAFPGTGGSTGVGGNGSTDLTCEQINASAGADPKLMGFSVLPPPADVVMATDPPPPISGGTLLVLHDGITAVAADPDRDQIYVVDLVSRGLRANISLKLHDEPGRLVEDAAGKVHVALRHAGELVTIDPLAGQVTQRFAVCTAPRGIAYDAATDLVHVACSTGELVSFTSTGTTPTRTLNLGRDLRDVVVAGSDLMVTRFRTAEVLRVDAAGVMLDDITPPSFRAPDVAGNASFAPAVAWRAVPTPDGGMMMVHQRGKDGQVNITPGGYGGLNPCDTIVHTCVSKMRPGHKPEAGPAMPGFVLPVDIAVSPDGNRTAIIAAGNGHLPDGFGLGRRLFVGDSNDMSAEWNDGTGRGCGNDDKHGPSPSPVCGGFGTGGAVGGDGMPILPIAASAPGTTDGTETAEVPSGGAGAATGTTGGGTAGGAGGSSGGVGPSTTCMPDLPAADSEPIAVTFQNANTVLVQERDPALIWVVDLASGSIAGRINLSQVSRQDTGHLVFHNNSGGGLACASCHPEGHEDGRVWNFQCEGPRRTQELAGGLQGTEPFHWGGDLADFPHLVDAVFVGRMSGPTLTREQQLVTLRWLNAVPARPGVRLASDPQVQRGKALFEDGSVGCATCHTGEKLTNNKTVNVGTSAAFQVPSLRQVGWRAPFMHDGCAPTLTGRFDSATCDGADLHGRTSQLAPAQVDDLVSYLESL